jgi:hypothetical protein
VHRVLLTVRGLSTDGPCVADGPWVGGGQSIFYGALLEALVAFSDGPREQRGQSARVPQMVRPYCADSPPLPR